MSQRTYYSEEAEKQAKMKTSAIVAVCLALGATIGTAIAVLFAPQSGEATREELNGIMDDQLEKGREATNTAIDRLQQQIDELRDRFSELTS